MLKKSTLEDMLRDDLSDIWNVLRAEEKRIVADNFTIHHYKKNQIIYAEKDDPEYLWCLLKGKVKMYKSGVGDRVQILRLYRPVQYFGYASYFAEEAYVSSASAFEPSTLGCIHMDVVTRLIRGNNDLAMFFINELARCLGGSDTKIVNLTQNYGLEDDEATLKIAMSREDLANLSNMTTSNAIRTLTTFVSEHLIVVDGRRIKIINEAQLRKISKFG
jgi:CRP-like cAMP-binding protein